jgi:hypothetical protein
VVDERDAADGLRAKGDERAVDRRNGFEDEEVEDDGPADVADAIVAVCNGGRDEGPADVGRPPGVSARVREMPIPLRASTECE